MCTTPTALGTYESVLWYEFVGDGTVFRGRVNHGEQEMQKSATKESPVAADSKVVASFGWPTL
jgi:hypothetical protein